MHLPPIFILFLLRFGHKCSFCFTGPGLAFIAYPQAAAMMPFPQFWNVCFFLMLLFLTVDTHVRFLFPCDAKLMNENKAFQILTFLCFDNLHFPVCDGRVLHHLHQWLVPAFLPQTQKTWGLRSFHLLGFLPPTSAVGNSGKNQHITTEIDFFVSQADRCVSLSCLYICNLLNKHTLSAWEEKSGNEMSTSSKVLRS